jgi:hypothetical protein
LHHISHTHKQLARILEAERYVTVRLSQIILELPDENPDFRANPQLLENTQAMGQNIVTYLNSIADFQETIAAQLGLVNREHNEQDEEE